MIRLVRLNEVQYVETEVASERLQAEGFIIAPIPESEEVPEEVPEEVLEEVPEEVLEEVPEEAEEKKSRGRTRRKAVSDDEGDAN